MHGCSLGIVMGIEAIMLLTTVLGLRPMAFRLAGKFQKNACAGSKVQMDCVVWG